MRRGHLKTLTLNHTARCVLTATVLLTTSLLPAFAQGHATVVPPDSVAARLGGFPGILNFLETRAVPAVLGDPLTGPFFKHLTEAPGDIEQCLAMLLDHDLGGSSAHFGAVLKDGHQCRSSMSDIHRGLAISDTVINRFIAIVGEQAGVAGVSAGDIQQVAKVLDRYRGGVRRDDAKSGDGKSGGPDVEQEDQGMVIRPDTVAARLGGFPGIQAFLKGSAVPALLADPEIASFFGHLSESADDIDTCLAMLLDHDLGGSSAHFGAVLTDGHQCRSSMTEIHRGRMIPDAVVDKFIGIVGQQAKLAGVADADIQEVAKVLDRYRGGVRNK
jgi:hypothetical protein